MEVGALDGLSISIAARFNIYGSRGAFVEGLPLKLFRLPCKFVITSMKEAEYDFHIISRLHM